MLQPFVPREGDMLILQECYTHELESMVVYAPIDIATLKIAMKVEDSSMLPLLPSGITISGDGRQADVFAGESEGSLVTLVSQVLATTPPSTVAALEKINTLVTTTMEKIKVSLGCFNLDQSYHGYAAQYYNKKDVD